MSKAHFEKMRIFLLILEIIFMPENPEKPKYNEEEEKKAIAKAKAKKDATDADPEILRDEGALFSGKTDYLNDAINKAAARFARNLHVISHDPETGTGVIGDARQEPEKENLSREQLVMIAKKFGMTDKEIGQFTAEWVDKILKPFIAKKWVDKYPEILEGKEDLANKIREIEDAIINGAKAVGIPHEEIYKSNTFDLFDVIKERLKLISQTRQEEAKKDEESLYTPGVGPGTPLEEKPKEIRAVPGSEEEMKKRWDEVMDHYKVLQSLLHKAYFRPEDEKKYLEHYNAIKQYYADPKNSGDKNFTNNKINFELADYLGKFYQKKPTMHVLSDLGIREGLVDANAPGKLVGELKVNTGPAAKIQGFEISNRSERNDLEVLRRNRQAELLQDIKGLVRDVESGKPVKNASEIFNKTADELLGSYEEWRKADARPQTQAYINEKVNSLAQLSERFDKLVSGEIKPEKKKKKPAKARKFDNGTEVVFVPPLHSEKRQERQAARREKIAVREATHRLPKEDEKPKQRVSPRLFKEEIPPRRVVEDKQAEVPAEAPKIDMKALESEIRQKALTIKDYVYGKYPNLTVEEKRGKIKELFTIYQTKLLERLKKLKRHE